MLEGEKQDARMGGIPPLKPPLVVDIRPFVSSALPVKRNKKIISFIIAFIKAVFSHLII